MTLASERTRTFCLRAVTGQNVLGQTVLFTQKMPGQTGRCRRARADDSGQLMVRTTLTSSARAANASANCSNGTRRVIRRSSHDRSAAANAAAAAS